MVSLNCYKYQNQSDFDRDFQQLSKFKDSTQTSYLAITGPSSSYKISTKAKPRLWQRLCRIFYKPKHLRLRFNDTNIDWSLEKCYTKDFRKNLKKLKDLAHDVDIDYVYFYFQFSPQNKEDERREGLEGLRSIADKHTRALFHLGCSLLEGKLIAKDEEAGSQMLLIVKGQNRFEYEAQVDALLAGIKK